MRRSALDPFRMEAKAAALDRALAARRASRPANHDRSTKAAQTRRHDVTRDPLFNEQVRF